MEEVMIGEYILGAIVGIVSVHGLITKYLEYDRGLQREAREVRTVRHDVER